MTKLITLSICLLGLLTLSMPVFGQVSITSAAPVTENFDTIGTSATATLPPDGAWIRVPQPSLMDRLLQQRHKPQERRAQVCLHPARQVEHIILRMGNGYFDRSDQRDGSRMVLTQARAS